MTSRWLIEIPLFAIIALVVYMLSKLPANPKASQWRRMTVVSFPPQTLLAIVVGLAVLITILVTGH